MATDQEIINKARTEHEIVAFAREDERAFLTAKFDAHQKLCSERIAILEKENRVNKACYDAEEYQLGKERQASCKLIKGLKKIIEEVDAFHQDENSGPCCKGNIRGESWECLGWRTGEVAKQTLKSLEVKP
jgi:hypothetical protein